MLKTGGGIFIPKLTSIDQKILSLLKDNYFSINNNFDSNVEISATATSSITEPLPRNEDILIIYEEDEMNQTTAEGNEQDMQEVSKEPIKDEQPKKRIKLHSSVRKSQPKDNEETKKNMEIFDKKLDILNLMRECEEENLKGKRLDNEIKLIVKQREMIELEIKKVGFDHLHKQ